MSQSSNEKPRDETSSLELDEDSGHDSVDDINSPADERERIASLETAVAWIRQEVDKLKTYDKDILQELWKIRNTVRTLREGERKPPARDESSFLDETMDDRSPTPESQFHEVEAEDHSLPSSPSPPPLNYMAADGNHYTEGTLNLMASAPSHLRKSSDDLVLEEFFGTEQLTKFDMFKKQISSDNLLSESNNKREGLSQITEEGMRPGVSMPNISNPPSSSLLSYHNNDNGPVKLRLAKNRLSDANRMSYDVAFEMEKLRTRLQETAKQELAEFDRKFSPKMYHSNVMAAENANNHSRQGSLDSSISQQVATPPLEALRGHGHSRQHSLPIDPKFLRHLQQNQSNETTPTLGTPTLATHKSGWRSPSLDRPRSPTPPLMYGHIRQISGGSMSSEGGTFSPPLTPMDGPQNPISFPTGRAPSYSGAGYGVGLSTQHFKQNNPPGMTRIASDGGYNWGSSNSLSRASPEGNGRPHYSTSVIKRGKRGSLDSIPPPSASYPQHSGAGMYKYEEKVPNGRPNAHEQPKRRSRGEDTETNFSARVGNGGVGRYTQQLSPPRMEGNIPASPKLTRMPEKHGDNRRQPPAIPLPTKRTSEPAGIGGNWKNPPSSISQEDIEPYMTSKHIKSQMNFNYTPFSQHQQRSHTVSSADAPKLTKQPASAKSAKNTWI